MAEEFDVAVLGAGLRGLAAALHCRRQRPDARLLVVDAASQPGGSVRTTRTNGFVCETGPFAFREEELAPLCALLRDPPPRLACLPAARRGRVFTGQGLLPIDVDPLPWSFRSGNEELVQACRRELGNVLRLGREAVAVDRRERFVVSLGGQVPGQFTADELVVALPDHVAGRLLGRFDPALPDVASRLQLQPRAMVWFAGEQRAAPELTGYGIVPADDVESPVAEMIFCSEVFPGRALPGRFLVRLELSREEGAGEAALLATAEGELRHWTGTRAELGLGKVHTFADPVPDGARVETGLRLRELPSRVPGLRLA